MIAHRRLILSGSVGVLLILTVLQQAADDRFVVGSLALVYVGVGLIAVASSDRRDGTRGILAGLCLGLLGMALAWIVLRQWHRGIPATNRAIHVTLIFAATVGFVSLSPGAQRFARANLPYLIGAFAVLGAYLAHVPALAPGSGLASYPIFTGIIFTLGLLVVPRYVPRRDLLWVIAAVTAGLVVLGLVGYVSGPYALGPTRVSTWESTIRLGPLDTGIGAMRSVFPNPNTLGLVAFAGALSALVLGTESLRRGGESTHVLATPLRDWPSAERSVAAGLLILSTVGLALSGSRASYLSMAVGACVYFATVFGGSAGRRYGTLATVTIVALGLGGMVAGYVPVDPGYRFALWRGSLGAIADLPSILGYGMVSGSAVIEPYVRGPAAGFSPHNSYLATIIHVGVVGGLGYLLLTVGNVVDAVVGYPPRRQVNPGVVALAVGFLVHQLFEAYTLFGFRIGSVLATLVVGALLASRVQDKWISHPMAADSTSSETAFTWAVVSHPPKQARPPDWARA